MTLTAQQIEKDLAELWKDDNGAGSRKMGLQRVYTTNLVAYAPDHAEGYRVEQILNDLAEKHPGRYILIRPAADPTEPPLRYYVLGHCFFGSGREKRVCCDIIKMVAQKEVIENLYGFTFSLLLPDLPVEFWWPGDLPYQNVFFDKMAEQAGRVWVDSSKFKEPTKSLSRLASFWHSRYPHTLLGDLNWLRIQRWRALIAEIFDGAWSSYLREIKKVTIEYGEGNQPTRSFFMACWMASQLGWKYKGERFSEFPQELTFEGAKGPVTVSLKPVPVADKRDRIFAVGVSTQGSHEGIFTVIRDQDPHCVVAHSEIDHKTAFSRVISFEHLHSNQLLDLGLKHLEPDPVWEKTLRMAGTLFEKPDLLPADNA
ncbi:MAG TPA: glucose-6-phosphate dehydrogenase assembly protein OpcA [bacterium]|nr:glucose-6-phosphate dehydrogenase assembly protein OpcA [bacterium]